VPRAAHLDVRWLLTPSPVGALAASVHLDAPDADHDYGVPATGGFALHDSIHARWTGDINV
jgi:hypothetical protein